jgi:RNA polymerase sigma-70 factor, ECF subfamily
LESSLPVQPTLSQVAEREQKRLASLAYGILGSLAEAEDVVQDALVRLQETDASSIRRPEAWLTTVVSHLSIDRLRSARHQREIYPGQWLPEPVWQAPSPEQNAITRSRLSIALLHLLEKLEPEQRAVFVLRDVFDHSYKSIAEMLNKSEAACRKMMTRARAALQHEQAALSPSVSSELLAQFTEALSNGDEMRLLQLLAPDAVLVADGGGKVPSALNPIYSSIRIVKFILGVRKKLKAAYEVTPITVNSEPGLLAQMQGRTISVMAFAVAGGRVTRVYWINNPDKLLPQGHHYSS